MDFESGASGGGFTNNNDGNFDGGGTQDTEKKRRSYDDQTLIPVTISMAMKTRQNEVSDGDGTMVLEDGRSLTLVKCIGAVRNVGSGTTTLDWLIEDGTGSIDVKEWTDDNDPVEVQEIKRSALKEGIYVKVIGKVTEYNGKKQIVANSVRQISSGNELTHHLLDVMYSAEQFKRADIIVAPQPVTMDSSMQHGGYNSSSVASNHHEQQSSGGIIIGNDHDGGREEDGIRDLVMQVMQKLHDENSETGTSVARILAELPNVSESDTRSALNSLSEEGNIYSTIDENMFKLSS